MVGLALCKQYPITMTHQYTITGMTCSGCEAKVLSTLLKMPHVLSASVSKNDQTAVIEMEKHIPLFQLQEALGGEQSKYRITSKEEVMNEMAEESWFIRYKPVLLLFLYITGITLLIQTGNHHFHWMQWMNHFMAAFFLTFSFFKLLNLKGFAHSYSMYDVVAKRWHAWGYIYAFLELLLGAAFLIDFAPLATSIVTLLVMSVSIIGVLQSVWNQRKIQCACLGSVFELPMSTITIIEDALMIGMSIMMLFLLQ